MKPATIREATEAHGWLGIIISIALFIIFWAGSITLFYSEIRQWAELPHFPIDTTAESVSTNEMLDNVLSTINYNPSGRITIVLPGRYSPLTTVYTSAIVSPNEQEQSGSEGLTEAKSTPTSESAESESKPEIEYKGFIVDPKSGVIRADHEQFHLADFMYELHYNLKLPAGTYIVGVVTLFFLILIMTGLVIQIKKLVKNFFLYRKDKTTRNKMTDLHNVIGVISLPYSFIFALTGLMFNLGVVYQIGTMYLEYDGDRNAMLEDAGVISVREPPSGIKMDMPDIDALVADINKKYSTDISLVRILNYRDENAIIRLYGAYGNSFSQRHDFYYRVKDGTFPPEYNPEDAGIFNDGVTLLYRLHFADFAGADLRFLYFVLGIGVCGMIVAGNVLWFVKRTRKGKESTLTTTLVRALTLGGCTGTVVATSLAFLFERVLPIEMAHRSSAVEYGFLIALLVTTAMAFFVKNHRYLIAITLHLSAAMLFTTVCYEWLFFHAEMQLFWSNGNRSPIGMSGFLLVTAAALAMTAFKLIEAPKPNNKTSTFSRLEGDTA